MTDTQILTMVLPIVLALTALIYRNSRITDAKETLRAELGEAMKALRLEMSQGVERVISEIRRLRTELEKHEFLKH